MKSLRMHSAWNVACFLFATSTAAIGADLVQPEEYVSADQGDCISAIPQNGKVLVQNKCLSVLQVEYCLERPKVNPDSPSVDKVLAAIARGDTLAPLCEVGSSGVISTEPVGRGIKFSNGVPSTEDVDSMMAPRAGVFAAQEARLISYSARLAEYMHFIACPENTSMRLSSLNNRKCIDYQHKNRLQSEREKRAEAEKHPQQHSEADDLFSSAAGKSTEQLQSETSAMQTVHSSGGGNGVLDALGTVAGMGILKNSADLAQGVTAMKALNGDSGAASELMMGAVRKDIAKNKARQAQPQTSSGNGYVPAGAGVTRCIDHLTGYECGVPAQ